jgi:hypothetical protein
MTCKVYEYTLYTLHGDADEACALRCGGDADVAY